MSERIPLAVYGTLRKGQPFYNSLSDPLYVRGATLRGYKMYDFTNGLYPVCIQTDHLNDTINVDILELTLKDLGFISMRERSAGYIMGLTSDQATYDLNHIGIWIYRTSDLDLLDPDLVTISGGDWIKYLKTLG